MTRDPLADVVSDQYEKWVYPEPILDLPTWLEGNWQWFDPSHAHTLLWPDRAYRPDMDILIAGCGTSQAAVFAYTNPEATVVAVDVSQASLDHERYLKDKYALDNLHLHRMPIEEVGALDRDFDLIVTTGVLHHMADPQVGANALAALLRPDGVLAVMLYAKYGRLGVEMMQGVFRELGLRQDEESLAMVRSAIEGLASDHPVRSYLSVAPDVSYDAGLVDTFLHGRERDYTIDDCLDLMTGAGLVLQDMFLKSSYYPQTSSDDAFHSAVAMLPRERQWAIMERINSRNGCHFFTACRPQVPRTSWEIEFETDAHLDYVPSWRFHCGLDGAVAYRPGWSVTLTPAQLVLAQLIDGHRTIRQVIGHAPAQFGRDLFRSLWQTDFIAMNLSGRD